MDSADSTSGRVGGLCSRAPRAPDLARLYAQQQDAASALTSNIEFQNNPLHALLSIDRRS